MKNENLYTLKEVSQVLGVSARTLSLWHQRGWLLVITLPNGRHRVPASEVARLIGEALHA